jgi:dipeptidyl aminopeptidase/acylaminoacyl peptidase
MNAELYKTSKELVCINLIDKSITEMEKDKELNYSYSISEDEKKIAYISQTKDKLPEIFVRNMNEEMKITNYSDQLSMNSIYDYKIINWKSLDNTIIEGLLFLPKTKHKKMHLITILHGGHSWHYPMNEHILYFERFDPYPTLQWLKEGIAIFVPHFRGSSGYGMKFKRDIINNEGFHECNDVQTGLDYLIANFNIDSKNIGVAGWSYGGYVSALFATKYSEYIKVASVGSPCDIDVKALSYTSSFNYESLFSTDLWVWESNPGYVSPLKYIKKERNLPPFLLQHGEDDDNIPISQSFALYRYLKYNNHKVKFIRYKNIGHTLNKPSINTLSREQNYEWFKKYLD